MHPASIGAKTIFISGIVLANGHAFGWPCKTYFLSMTRPVKNIYFFLNFSLYQHLFPDFQCVPVSVYSHLLLLFFLPFSF